MGDDETGIYTVDNTDPGATPPDGGGDVQTVTEFGTFTDQPGGNVVDASGEVVGTDNGDGTWTDTQGRTFDVQSGALIDDGTGDTAGSFSYDAAGNVIDPYSGKTIGTANADGTWTDKNGNVRDGITGANLSAGSTGSGGNSGSTSGSGGGGSLGGGSSGGNSAQNSALNAALQAAIAALTKAQQNNASTATTTALQNQIATLRAQLAASGSNASGISTNTLLIGAAVLLGAVILTRRN